MMAIKPIWLSIPILNTLQQIFLKLSAEQATGSDGHWLEQLLSSHWFLAALVAEIVCFVIWTTVLAELDLSKAFPLSAISYVFIMCTAWFLFGEPASTSQIVGSSAILLGISLIATAGSRSGST